jgi:hypothetical protein
MAVRQSVALAEQDVDAPEPGAAFVRKTTIEFDHEKAEWLINLKEVDGERPLDDRHVEYLKTAIERGTFRPELVSLAVCRFNGDLYRVNGQHTAWARSYLPAELPCRMDLFEYEADTLEELHALYAAFDRNKARSKRVVVSVQLKASDRFRSFSPTTLKLLPPGYAMYKWPAVTDRRAKDGEAVANAILCEDRELALRIGRMLNPLSRTAHGHLLRAPVIGAMFLTTERDAGDAAKFWESVASGVGFERADDPRNRLRSELLRMSIPSSLSTHGSSKRHVSSEYMLRACLVCWNAWRGGRELKLLRVCEASPRPAAI